MPIVIQKLIHIVAERLVAIEQIRQIDAQSCCVEAQFEFLGLNVIFAFLDDHLWLIFHPHVDIFEYQIGRSIPL